MTHSCWKLFIASVLVIIMTSALFVILLFLSNELSPEIPKSRFEKFLQEEERSLTWHECEAGLSLVVPQDGSIKNAVVPLTVTHDKSYPCEALSQFVGNPVDHEVSTMPSRYWWGSRAAYSFVLSQLSVVKSRELMIFTLFGSLLVAGISVFLIGHRTWVPLAPFLLFGLFFSGIYGKFAWPIGIGTAWAILAVAILAFLIKNSPSRNILMLFSMFAGMVCCFFWVMGGELLLLGPMVLLVTYFGLESSDAKSRFVAALKNLVMLSVGFFVATLVGILIRSVFYGWSETIGSFSGAVLLRTSMVAGDTELTPLLVFYQLVFRGFQYSSLDGDVLTWKILLVSSSLAGIIGFSLVLRKVFFGSKHHLYTMLVYVIALGYFMIRILVVPNHSYIHANMIGSFVFVALAMGWSLLLSYMLDN